jgi:hypothetical protein
MGRVRDQTLTYAIHDEIELLEHCLPEDDLVAENHRFFQCVYSIDLGDKRPAYINGLSAPVGIYSHLLSTNPQAEQLATLAGITVRAAPVSTKASAS